MAVTWTIPTMDRDITQGDKADVVTTIHWRASETDGDGNTGSAYGSVGVTLGSFVLNPAVVPNNSATSLASRSPVSTPASPFTETTCTPTSLRELP